MSIFSPRLFDLLATNWAFNNPLSGCNLLEELRTSEKHLCITLGYWVYNKGYIWDLSSEYGKGHRLLPCVLYIWVIWRPPTSPGIWKLALDRESSSLGCVLGDFASCLPWKSSTHPAYDVLPHNRSRVTEPSNHGQNLLRPQAQIKASSHTVPDGFVTMMWKLTKTHAQMLTGRQQAGQRNQQSLENPRVSLRRIQLSLQSWPKKEEAILSRSSQSIAKRVVPSTEQGL